ncbi:gluconeogenesis factor YvcK family protein [Dubosiella newyorkensis]|jgi:uncharacterized cofD-like protein|uniref:Putative gluconeogenesis factor n=1 Tax=Dubosiella newyorkensis TaxID=1862672 RepID=A0A1U7NQL5_9FIRM|nr:gluconeogenesis factor YvcK family protein [Dubosiella newyorkensis]MCI9040341.1 YvcK family protein [Dubosiella newyorkensis]OLU47926.1 hypothetical protein BO225_00385 [Dubosiella newyorkensis]
MKNIVVIGGGTGLSSMMMGMKKLKNVNLTAIVTVADDGGSTGRIRDVYHVPAMGDIRHVLSAMSQEENETLFNDLMNYRFEGDKDIGGHSLGNLIFLALMDTTGSFMGAIQSISKVLNVKGEILPSTLDVVTLYALMQDGTLVRGEKNIPNMDNHIEKIFYQQSITPFPKAIEAIEQADLIIYGIGSLYTSVIPNLIIQEISQAIYENPCPKIYFCNAMSQPGETDGYSLEDHIRALEKHSFKNPVDVAVLNESVLPDFVKKNYEEEGSYPVQMQESEHPYKIITRNLIMLDEKGRIRHNPDAVKAVLEEILEAM